ncbi:MAG TPA: GntR family transcriptional regulator [Hyphomicrobiaceae bacterium]|nr:GntR family transcriptional regulator [Hyphomicrobiaceae bacterium]
MKGGLATVTPMPVGRPEPEPRSLCELAYQLLVRMITSLELEPGSVIAERELISRLGIGRTPIREALQRLCVEGLVVHRPNYGMFVSEIAPSSVQQIYEFRAIIDSHLVRLAAQRASPEQIANLLAICRDLKAATRTDDLDHYIALDRQFYELLTHLSHNDLITEVVERIFHLHVRLWFFISTREGGTRRVAKAHAEMASEVAKAIARRDGEAAAKAIETYVAKRHLDITKLLWREDEVKVGKAGRKTT